MRWTFVALCALALVGCSSTDDSNLTYAVTVGLGGTGSGSVRSSPAGIDCGSACSASFKSGTQVTFTATPAQGSVFKGWGGDCSGSNTTCTLTVTKASVVNAAFDTAPAQTAKLEVLLQGSGSGSIDTGAAGLACTKSLSGDNTTCSKQVPVGQTVVINATSSDSTIAFQDCDTQSGDSCTVTVNADRTVQANFTLFPTLTVTKDGGGTGTVTSSPAGIDCGATCSAAFSGAPSVTLTATPAQGSEFTGWSGACSGTSTTCTVTVDHALSTNATFNIIPPNPTLTLARTSGPVTVTSSPAGIDCEADPGQAQTCSASFSPGQVVTLTATGVWGAATFTGCDSVSGSTCTVTLSSNATIQVAAPTQPVIGVAFSGSGAGSVTSNVTALNCPSTSTTCQTDTTLAPSDFPVSITAVADATSVFGHFTGCADVNALTCTFSSPSGNQSVGVVFHGAATGVVATPAREGVSVSWSAPAADGDFTGYSLSYKLQGDTTWIGAGTVDASATSATIANLKPGTAYDGRLTKNFSDTATGLTTDFQFTTSTNVTGSALDWNANEEIPTINGGKLAVSWDATTLYVGLQNSGGAPSMVNVGDSIWLAIDTDAQGSDVSGQTSVQGTIFPFKADRILEVTLTDASGTTFGQLLDPINGVVASPSYLSAVGTFDAFQISKADLGNPGHVRVAVAAYDGTTLQSTDLAPVNPTATDVWGLHTSFTGSLDSNSGLWDPAAGLTANTTLTTSDASNLVTLTVHQPGTVTGQLKIRGNLQPLDWDVQDTHYALVDDGQHGDGSAGDKIYGGKFNLDWQTGELFFKFMDDTTYAGTCDTAPCPEPLFNNDGTERIWTLSGAAETLPALDWNTVYDATHPFSVVFNLITQGTPTEVVGTGPLGSWTCGAGVALSDTLANDGNGNEIWGGQLDTSNQDFVTTPLEFKAIYGCGSYEGNGPNHTLNDDVINTRTLSWYPNTDTTF